MTVRAIVKVKRNTWFQLFLKGELVWPGCMFSPCSLDSWAPGKLTLIKRCEACWEATDTMPLQAQGFSRQPNSTKNLGRQTPWHRLNIPDWKIRNSPKSTALWVLIWCHKQKSLYQTSCDRSQNSGIQTMMSKIAFSQCLQGTHETQWIFCLYLDPHLSPA